MPRRKVLNRPKKVSVCLSPDEYKKILDQSLSSTCVNVSEYIRYRLSRKPIINKYRDQAVDEFLEVAIRLKNELTTIRIDLEKVINSGLRPEIMQLTIFSILQKSEEIRLTMINIYQSCLRR